MKLTQLAYKSYIIYKPKKEEWIPIELISI
jgi:hypothetical protein